MGKYTNIRLLIIIVFALFATVTTIGYSSIASVDHKDNLEVGASIQVGNIKTGNSTEVRGVYVVETADVSAALSDNLESDPNNLVVDSFTADGGSASVDWGVEYQLIIATYGEENEVSNDIANMRCGIDGDYWGDSNGSVDTPGGADNCSDEVRLTTTDDGFSATDPFLVGGDNHIYVNYQGNSGGFTLSRDETATIDEILIQTYW